jgi:hypothetical protein
MDLSGTQSVVKSRRSGVSPQRLMRTIEISIASPATKDNTLFLIIDTLVCFHTGHPNVKLHHSAATISVVHRRSREVEGLWYYFKDT